MDTYETISTVAAAFYGEYVRVGRDLVEQNDAIARSRQNLRLNAVQASGQTATDFDARANRIDININNLMIPRSDALEKGLESNKKQARQHKEEHLAEYIQVARELMHADLR